MAEAYIVEAVRTPIGKRGGALKDWRPDDLGATYDFFGGFRDLQRGTVRVLHNLSFVEDPTRLLRAIRYEATAAFGGTILDGAGKPQFTSPSSAGYQAAEWMVNQLKSGLIPPGNINVKNSVSQQTLMAKGTVASTFADYSGN